MRSPVSVATPLQGEAAKGRTRCAPSQLDAAAEEVRREGFCILRGHFNPRLLESWREAFMPLLERTIADPAIKSRGPGRYYVTLPFKEPFAEPSIFDDDDIVGICQRLVGEDLQLGQLATDTPIAGSEYQDVHRDTFSLFPESETETPPFQLAVNFPLVEVTRDNGPFEVARRTHLLPKAAAMARVTSGESPLEPVTMKLGDVMVRDVRAMHRGTPNKTGVPRPMVVLGYHRRWMFRPEVNIRIPRALLDTLSPRAKFMMRFNPVVESVDAAFAESYHAFAY